MYSSALSDYTDLSYMFFPQFFSAPLLSTSLLFSFSHFVFSILFNLMDFPLKREPKRAFCWYWSFYEIGTILFHTSMFRLNRNSSSKTVKTKKKLIQSKEKKTSNYLKRNILWENGIIETIDYAGIFVFVKNRAVSEKSVLDIVHLWSIFLAILDEKFH